MILGELSINNIAINPEDNPVANYLIVQSGELYEEKALPPGFPDYYIIKCNKKTGFSCLEALHLDGKTL